MYRESVEGARKQETMSPLTALGGNVCGTPSTTQRLPARLRMSHSRSSWILSAVANVILSYE